MKGTDISEQEKKPTMVSGRLVEFSYDMGDTSDRATVAVNAAEHYTKTLAWANELLATLQTHIPFAYDIASEPEVHILGGGRVKGMLSVEFMISFSLSNNVVSAKLEGAGFRRGLELIQG